MQLQCHLEKSLTTTSLNLYKCVCTNLWKSGRCTLIWKKLLVRSRYISFKYTPALYNCNRMWNLTKFVKVSFFVTDLQSSLRQNNWPEDCHPADNYQLRLLSRRKQILWRCVQGKWQSRSKISEKYIIRVNSNNISIILGISKRSRLVQMAKRVRYLEYLSDQIFGTLWWAKTGKSSGPVRRMSGTMPAEICEM